MRTAMGSVSKLLNDSLAHNMKQFAYTVVIVLRYLTTDSCSYTVGSVLSQHAEGKEYAHTQHFVSNFEHFDLKARQVGSEVLTCLERQ
jgi:hypothetical protein